MKKVSLAAGVLSALALTLTSCAQPPGSTTESPAASAPASSAAGAADFKACMVSDSGGFDDKSFNQLGYEGLTKAVDDLGLPAAKPVESAAETDFAPNLTNLADQGCGLIVTVGWAIYPLGNFLTSFAGVADAGALTVAYNLADVLNRMAFGVAVLAAGSLALDGADPRPSTPRVTAIRTADIEGARS